MESFLLYVSIGALLLLLSLVVLICVGKKKRKHFNQRIILSHLPTRWLHFYVMWWLPICVLSLFPIIGEATVSTGDTIYSNSEGIAYIVILYNLLRSSFILYVYWTLLDLSPTGYQSNSIFLYIDGAVEILCLFIFLLLYGFENASSFILLSIGKLCFVSLNLLYFRKRQYLFQRFNINETSPHSSQDNTQGIIPSIENIDSTNKKQHISAKRIVATSVKAASPDTLTAIPQEPTTEVPKQKKFQKIFWIVLLLSATSIAGAIGTGVYIYKSALLQERIISLNDELEGTKGRTSNLYLKLNDLQEKSDFMDEHIVFTIDNSRYYHTYDCKEWQDKGGFYAYNSENAEHRGYEPCPYCH